MWSTFVDILSSMLFALAQAYGGNLGLAIVTLSLLVRLGLLPLTWRIARRAQLRHEQLRALQPQIERLRKRYGSDPQRLAQELRRLYGRHGYRPFDAFSMLVALLQLLVGVGLYTAIGQGLGAGGRFLWIANLARPDVVLTILVAALTYTATTLNPELPQQLRILVAVLPTMITLVVVWRLAAGLGLYWAASSAVSIVQTAMLRRRGMTS